jgi:hypothetical protein
VSATVDTPCRHQSIDCSIIESPSLVLVINDTKLLMLYVKWFELDISNTCDEGVCGERIKMSKRGGELGFSKN